MNISKISGVNFGKLIIKPEKNADFNKAITVPFVAKKVCKSLTRIDDKSGDTDVFMTTTSRKTDGRTEYCTQIHTKDGKLIAQEKFHADHSNPSLCGKKDDSYMSPLDAFDNLADSVEDYFDPNAEEDAIRAQVMELIPQCNPKHIKITRDGDEVNVSARIYSPKKAIEFLKENFK